MIQSLRIVLTRPEMEQYAGRPLTDDEVTRIHEEILCSSIPHTITTIVMRMAQQP